MSLEQYVPALEWLGFEVCTFANGFYLSIPTGEYDRTYPDPAEYVNLGTVKEHASDYDNAQAIVMIIDAIEAKGMTLVIGGKAPKYWCGVSDEKGWPLVDGIELKSWPTRSIAVLEAAKALHEKEGGNG